MTLTERYHAELARHGFAADAAQLAAVTQLETLRARLARAARREAGWWWRLGVALGRVPPRRAIRGAYLWGAVGRGKTLLMDLFCGTLDVPARRAHFHHFMQDVHARLTALRPLALEDPLARIAADLAAETRVLCFDELFVSDIADAMLLGGLFAGLVGRGVTLVVTSNTPPAELYRDGLQRSRFLPAIALLERATQLVAVDGGVDYRLRQLERAPTYLDAHASATSGELEQRFAALAGGDVAREVTLQIEGRPLRARAVGADLAWFDFRELCEGPRSQNDYIEIARLYGTVVLTDVPQFTPADEDAARRFIMAIDEFYDRGVKLVISAATPPARLYRGDRLIFEFERAASRLVEMQSQHYLAGSHRA